MRIAMFAFAILMLAGACTHIGSGDPANFVSWRTGLVSSAQPDRAYLSRVGNLGYRTVINLAPSDSSGSIADEGQIVSAQGVAYVNIPVDFERPALQDFERFSQAMRDAAEGPVLVHCQANLRGSTFVFLYRVIHEAADPDEAVRLLTGVWVPNRVWMAFAQQTLARYGKSAEIL